MLFKEKQMEVLEAYDLTKSYRAAGELTGTDHHTVARLVAQRACGTPGEESVPRPGVTDTFADKIDEWIEKSSAKIRSDVAHERLVAMGYTGSERTTRRVVAARKATYERRTHRVYKPWITEPGMWLQYDFGDGPVVGGIATVLFCAWLAWSRFRVILPLRDRSFPSVAAALDTTLRIAGGAPTYLLTDNEKTVTDCHIAGVAVRNQAAVDLSRYYGVTIATCVPYDPESKGGSERTVGVAKADLVPTDYNLRDDYRSFDELSAACRATSESFNERIHAVTRAVPAEAIETERGFLHAIPDTAYTAAFGESRSVGWSSTISYRSGRYSVPDSLADSRVWVRVQAEEVVIVAGEGSGAHEVARHHLVGPGQASIDDTHYRHRPPDPLHRAPKAKTPAEARFLALGEGAKLYLVEAAAVGARRIPGRMAEAVTLASLHGTGAVDHALGTAAMAGRFAEGDLESILVHSAGGLAAGILPPASHSLAQGTAMWSALGGSAPAAAGDADEEGEATK